MMLDGTKWFPITGNIIFQENKPILSTPDDKVAYEIMELLTDANKGVAYTCISADGYYCKKKEKPND